MRLRYLIALVVLSAAPAAAQTPPDLTQVAMEDLLRIEVQRVFGASERLQPVTEAPSSVTIVTAREIARHGYRTLADILRSVRSFYISDDRNYSYVGVRGFSRPGDYSTRVLVLVNGHRVNDNVYDQAPIGADLGLDVAMFERVEIIRGPASSLYGTSAFFAVVNIITRNGASLDGVAVDVDAGTLGTGMARVSGGKRLANGVDFAVSGRMERSDGDNRLYFPAFDAAATNNGVADDLDRERVGDVYGHLTAGKFAFTAAFGNRRKVVPTASYGSVFNEQDNPERTTDRRTLVAGQYNTTVGGTHLVVDAGFDWYAYGGRYPFASDSAEYPVLLNRDGAQGVRWNTGMRLARQLPGHQTLTAGGEFYANVRQNQWSTYNDPSVPPALDDKRKSRQGGVYLQDEIRVRPWLLLNGGVRYDQYENFGRATPRAAVIVTPSASTSFKYLYGEAFRAPNAYELYYYGTTTVDLRPEFIRTNEVVWEQYTGEWLRTSVSAYRYTASQLITFREVESNSFDEFAFVNDGVIEASGFELEAEVRTKRGLQVLTSYVLQDARQESANESLTNSPRHMAKARVEVPFRARAFASAEWQFIGERSTLAGGAVGAASVVHLTAAWPISRALMLTGSVRNLFDRAYSDPGSDEHLPDSIPQTQRTARVGLRWVIGVR